MRSCRGVGLLGWCAEWRGLLLSSSPSLPMVRGKGGVTSPRAARGGPWRPPPTPDHTHQDTGHRAQGTGHAAVGLPLSLRTARASLNPQTPAPGSTPSLPGRKEAVPEVGQLGQVTLALLCPKRGPQFRQAPAGHQPGRGWLATDIRDLSPPWAPSAVRDPVSTPLPTLRWRSSSGWLGDVQARPWGMPVPSLPRWRRASSRFGESPRGWGSPPSEAGAAQDLGQKGFSGSSPPTGGKGRGRPRAGGSARADGDPGGRAPWSRGEGREPAYRLARAQLPAAPRPPHGFLRPGLPGRRWRAPGGRAGGRPRGGGRRARWVGPPRSPGVGGGGLAWRWEGAAGRGQGRHPSSQGSPPPVAWTVQQPGGRTRLGGVHLHVVSV